MREITVKLNTIERAKCFVKKANLFQCSILAFTDERIVDGKSILGIFSLNLEKPIKIVTNGDDEEQCIEELEDFVFLFT